MHLGNDIPPSNWVMNHNTYAVASGVPHRAAFASWASATSASARPSGSAKGSARTVKAGSAGLFPDVSRG